MRQQQLLLVLQNEGPATRPISLAGYQHHRYFVKVCPDYLGVHSKSHATLQGLTTDLEHDTPACDRMVWQCATIQVAVPEARLCTLTCIVVLLEIMWEDLHPLPAQALLCLHHWCETALAQTLVSTQRENSSCALRCNATEASFRVADRCFRSSLEHERCSGLNVAYQFTRRPARAAGLRCCLAWSGYCTAGTPPSGPRAIF